MVGSVGCFEPMHPGHAIQQFTMQVNFASPAPDWVEWRAVARWKALRSELVGKLPAFRIDDGLGGLVSVSFGNVAPDGSLRNVLRIMPQTLAYVTSSYTTWTDVQREAVELFRLASADTLLWDTSPVAEVGIKYQNRFRWIGDVDMFDPELLIRVDSPWINSRSYHNKGFWHCHCGEFQEVSASIRRLINVNTSSLSEDTMAGEQRLISIDLTLTDVLNAPDYDVTDAISGDAGMNWIVQRFDDLHKSEKIIVSEVVVPEMQEVIKLKAQSSV